ncbi:MAG: hypothetical protein ACKON8_07425, partial [Planctomycetota bacterium]
AEAERMATRVVCETAGPTRAGDAPATDALAAGSLWIDRAYRLAFGRPPSAAEAARAIGFLSEQAADHVAAGRTAAEAGPDALADLCQMLLASNEFLHVE